MQNNYYPSEPAPQKRGVRGIKVGIVNYLNTKPLLYGINHSEVAEQIELVSDYPAHIADDLISGKLDLGLMPVSVIPKLKEYHIITDYCIGCNGEVASVCLFSEQPMDQLKKIYLDYQSRTSVHLLKILLKKHWKKEIELVDAEAEDYRNLITGSTGGLVIGDRAFEQRNISKYQYDLGLAWKEMTGLPFVFAAWVSNKKLSDDFIHAFNEANKLGVENIDKVISEINYNHFDLDMYYRENVSFYLDDEKRKALEMFLNFLKE